VKHVLNAVPAVFQFHTPTGAAGIVVVVAGALLVGGSLTQPPTASAAVMGPKAAGLGPAGSKLD
jgi:hypothetical protein